MSTRIRPPPSLFHELWHRRTVRIRENELQAENFWLACFEPDLLTCTHHLVFT